MTQCVHEAVRLINPHELVRKFECGDCGGVMTCSCEAPWATRFLGHQLSHAVEPDSKAVVPVTLGFQDRVCATCRGIAEEAHPKAELYGSSSKVRRYYWREIYADTTTRFADWAEASGYSGWSDARAENEEKYKAIEREVVAEMIELHERNPKYHYHDVSQATVLADHNVEIVKLHAQYATTSEGRLAVRIGDQLYSPEGFASQHFQTESWQVISTESRPFHVLFGVFMWPLIQDSADPKLRRAGFGSRCPENPGQLVFIQLPEDFGSKGYPRRRDAALRKHLQELRSANLLELFEEWLDPSKGLRDYLWACEPKQVDTARDVLEVLPRELIVRIMRFLGADYWGRYVGWPDLLVHNSAEFFFAEVKSSRDRLSLNQKNWITANDDELQLPFRLVKIHKQTL